MFKNNISQGLEKRLREATEPPDLSTHFLKEHSKFPEPIAVPGQMHRVALAQIHCPGGKIAQNLSSIIDAIQTAKSQKADLVVFPELALPGYCSMDLANDPNFILQNLKALDILKEYTESISAVVGFIAMHPTVKAPGGSPIAYNAAAFIHDKKIYYIQSKELLPNYGVFNEKRYYTPSYSRNVLEGEDGRRIGIAICEDLWSVEHQGRDIVGDLKELGADLVLSLNASPYEKNGLIRRMQVLTDAVKKHRVCLAYTNNVGSFDNYDGELLFDGNSLVLNEQGVPIGALPAFRDCVSTIELSSPAFIKLGSRDTIVDIHDGLVRGISDFFDRQQLKKAIIGLSGGIDSAVVACLAVEALGSANVIAVTMPSDFTSKETLGDSHKLASNLGIEIYERSITPEYNVWLDQAQKAFRQPLSSITLQNKQSRIRQAILMEYSNQTKGSIVLNTGNKTECALGYFTLGGDSGGGLAVIGDLLKGEVVELAQFVNRIHELEVIPRSTLERSPTAELAEGQKDEDELPASYPVLDKIIEALVVNNISEDEISEIFGRDLVKRVRSLIISNEGKRRQLPPSIRISQKSFGSNRRIPMIHD